MDDEIKRGLESLVPEELENHLIFNSNRLKTFEDARSEIVTYVEEKIGLRIRKPSEAGFCDRSGPTDVGVVDCNASNHTGKQTSGKGNQSKSWSVSEPSISGKGKGKEIQGKSKGLSRGARTKVPKAQAKAKRRKWNRLTLLTRRGFTRNGVRTKGTKTGILMNGMTTGVLLDGVKIASKHMSHRQAHFHLKAQNGYRRTWTQERWSTHFHRTSVLKE